MTLPTKKPKNARTLLLRAAAIGAGAALVGCSDTTAVGSVIYHQPDATSDAEVPIVTGVNVQDAATDADSAVGTVDAGISVLDAGDEGG